MAADAPPSSLPPVPVPGGVWLRHERAGLRHSATSDWDVAVRDAEAAGRELEAAAGAPDLRIEHQYVVQRYYPWGEVDFLPCFEWNGIEYLDQERFWSRVETGEDGLPRPCLAHDAFICWMSQVLWGACYRETYDEFLAMAWREDRREFEWCLESAFGRSWRVTMGRWLGGGTPGEAAGAAKGLRRALAVQALRRAPGECLWRQARHWWTELKLHLRPPFPWIAILGPDGSGKSSVIEGVTHELAARRIKVAMVHWRPQLLWKAAEAPGGIVTDPHGKPPRGMLISAIKLVALGAEWWMAHLGRLLHVRAKTSILLSDRFFADLLVDQRRYRYGAPLHWARWAFRFFPQPQRVLFLLAEAGQIYARKQEVEFSELERQLEAYRQLAAEFGDRAVIVDAGRPLDEVVARVTDAVVGTCRERTPLLARRLAPARRQAQPAPAAPAAFPPPAAPLGDDARGLRILMSAYACNPNRGAEANVAWNLVRELSQRHEVWVLTRENNRHNIESSGEDWIRRVYWEYLDPPPALSFWRQGQRGLHPFYVWWQWLARRRAIRLMKRIRFDVAHHITFGTYVVPSLLSDLGVPLVFGPVGGGEKTPEGLSQGYRLRGHWEEAVRNFGHRVVDRSGFLRHWYRAAGWTLAATPVTAEILRGLGVERLSLMPQSAFGDDDVERFISSGAADRARAAGVRDGALHLVTASRLVHWKAIDLGLEAVAEARRRGVDVRLTVLQEGPEKPRLLHLAKRLGLSEVVQFPGRLPSLSDVFETMSAADALLHPALHEAFGQACLEALALGVPVICLDWGGPGVIVDPSCGFKIPPGDRDGTIARLADAIETLAERKAAGGDFAEAARARAARFRWSDFAAEIEELYGRLVVQGDARNP